MDIYKDIACRTNGEIYIGVVGPVRTGKSTFIKRFMDLCVLPYMEEGHVRERTIDELPQSSQGKTIMTTEPKFIPQQGACIHLSENQEIKVRLVDCVGFVVDGANGHMEGEHERMVKTPWMEEEVPFEKAAKIGTLKVIKEHATIGVVITTDGSFGEIPRESYIEAEEETIAEMEKTGKPYAIVFNCEKPYSGETERMKKEMEEKYHRPVIAMNVRQMQKGDVTRLLESVLMEFTVTKIEFFIPKWTEMLPREHEVKQGMIGLAMGWMESIRKMRDLSADTLWDSVKEQSVCVPSLRKMNPSDGTVEIRMEVEESYYYQFLSEITGLDITGEYDMINGFRELARKRQTYESVEAAMDSVSNTGYGVVIPQLSDIRMEDPVLMVHGGKYGVKIRGISPSVHMIRANIETEIAPIVGSKEQAEDLIAYIEGGESRGEGVWNVNIFGKSLGELMEDGIRDKINRMDEECQMQLQNTMQKIVNESTGGLVCIII